MNVINFDDNENIRLVKQNRAVLTFKAAEKERHDKNSRICLKASSFHVHKECATDYTKPDKIKASLKRLKNDVEVDSCSSSPPKRRLSTCGYDEKIDCFVLK